MEGTLDCTTDDGTQHMLIRIVRGSPPGCRLVASFQCCTRSGGNYDEIFDDKTFRSAVLNAYTSLYPEAREMVVNNRSDDGYIEIWRPE